MKQFLTSSLMLTSLFLASAQEAMAKKPRSKELKKAMTAEGVCVLSSKLSSTNNQTEKASKITVLGYYNGQYVVVTAYDKNHNNVFQLDEIGSMVKFDITKNQAVMYRYQYPQTESVLDQANTLESSALTEFGQTKIIMINPTPAANQSIRSIKELLQEPMPG